MNTRVVLGLVALLQAFGPIAATADRPAEEALSPYERGRLELGLANAEYDRGQYRAAREHFQNALASGGLNAQERSQAQYQIGQLYVAEGLWAEGAAALEQWLGNAPEPSAAAYYLLAVAYYQLGDFARGLPAAQTAVEKAVEPPETWLQLVVALLQRRLDFAAAAAWLERLIERAPGNKDYWLQLSSAYQQLDQYDRALAAMQLAYSAGLLTADSDIERLADLLVYNGLPQRAAQILERAITARSGEVDASWWAKLADARVAAGELDEAVAPLARVAAAAATGDGFVRLAELHVERREWTAALAALNAGLAKGGLADPTHAALLKGVALYGTGDLVTAREWFERAAKAEAHRPVAGRYIEAIDATLS